ncbi:MAG: TetR family transcriptional regulator C-terminal domain-containing protein, partial [Bacteroidia bacterium]|nr:TetR family transcriptional regulator C-terminal domain-containing protein [Bacteroidia bacterium]
NQSELYNSYPARQKILSYFFTFFEVARTERTFISRTLHKDRIVGAYAKKFKEIVLDIIQEGIATEDIQERFYSSYYPDIVWNLHYSLLLFWINDDSENFVETEKAIEIYSKVPLEIMGPNIFDSIFETIKFSIKQINIPKLLKRL